MKQYTKAEAKKEISELVKNFEKDISEIKKEYSEAQIENNFLKPFFESLNWNVGNRGLEPSKQVFILQQTKKSFDQGIERPDYLIKVPDKNNLQMKSCFFLDAKQAKYDLKTNAKYIKQVYKYAWSTLNSSENPNSRVRLAVLFDFEEFRMFDCYDPTPLEKKYEDRFEAYNKHIVKDWTYKDYINKFDEVWDLLEYNNVVNGSLDKWFLTEKQIADNRITPDKKFLDDLKRWRKDIARSMFKNDKSLSDYQLTKATLLFINRIIFVKMLSDRGIEPDHLTNILSKLSKSKKTEVKLYELCKDIFERLDHVYNGSVFNYDSDSDDIELSNNVLINIFEELKPENSIYTLAAMPVEIIGSVYELFIAEQIVKKGAGITLVPKYDEKKEKGVYYTPRYIVEYIVENTLGKKLEECNNPGDVEKLKVLDPACGSGSFLIVAYQKLIDWYKKWYFDQLMKFTKKDNIEQFSNKNKNKVRVIGEKTDYYTIHLSHKLKSEILTNNIFGVDLDQQAVMVTKFSLSMKALEDSTHEEVIEDYDLFKFPTLPNLDNNVKWGNSLIGSDFYVENKPSLFNEKEKRKIQVFDWDSTEGFQEIMKSGGFDVVIGNPPYVNNKELDNIQKEYFIKIYKTSSNQFDLYTLFIEKGISILKLNGNFGYIVPDAILDRSSAEFIREFILNNTSINTIFNLYSVFEKVNVGSAILILNNNINQQNNKVIFIKSNNYNEFSNKNYLIKKINQNDFNNLRNKSFLFINTIENEIIKKINNIGNPLKKISFMGRGEELGKNSDILSFNVTNTSIGFMVGEDIQRYHLKSINRFIIKKNVLKDFKLYDAKIVVRQVGNKINATLDDKKYITIQSIYSIVPNKDLNKKYILGILNSKAIDFLYQNLYNTKEIFPRVLLENLKEIPIRQIDFNNKSEKQMHDKLVQLVEQMLENQEYFHNSKTEDDKKIYKKIIDTLDNQIDELVYKLYDLTEEEIKIIQNS